MELDKIFTVVFNNPEPRCERAPGNGGMLKQSEEVMEYSDI